MVARVAHPDRREGAAHCRQAGVNVRNDIAGIGQVEGDLEAAVGVGDDGLVGAEGVEAVGRAQLRPLLVGRPGLVVRP